MRICAGNGRHGIPVSLSIGGAVSGEEARNLENLFQKADMALYTVKREDRNGLAFWTRTKSDLI